MLRIKKYFRAPCDAAGMLAGVGKSDHVQNKMAPAQGLEPRRTVLETVMLPLHHAGVPDRGLEPR